MQWLLRNLGLAKVSKSEDQSSKSWLSCTLLPECISCKWILKEEVISVVVNEANSRLTLRIKDATLPNANSEAISTFLAIEASVYKNEATIMLPTSGGMILVELGYKDRNGVFISLEYKLLDLGTRILIEPAQQDWFSGSKVDNSIHQKMYELATRYHVAGGSEKIAP